MPMRKKQPTPPNPNTHIVGVSLGKPEKEEEQKYLPMLHGKATDAIAGMAGLEVKENQLNNTGIVESGEVKLVINKFNELSGTLGVSTHKLLSKSIANFTALNHTGQKRDLRTLRVAIPLKEYALQCGYDVEPHIPDGATDEEIEKENKRAENALKNARRKIKKDISILVKSSVHWEEKVKGKAGDFDIANILGRGGIRNGYIQLEFTLSMGEYLLLLPITQYPVALLGVDERNPNAYTIGLKMAEHFNLDNNQIRGTAQLLKVKTLLEYTNLPTIEAMREQRRSWEERIKEPFETALDALTQCGLLADWRYSKSKGEELTDEEATTFTSYEDWEEALVYFTLANAPDHTERLERRAEEKKQRQTKKRKTTKKKKEE